MQTQIRFRHLQTLIEVARQRSVGLAASQLNVSQPAVSKTIRELEKILGTQLVERDGRGIRITAKGELFLQHAGASLSALRRGVDALAAHGNGSALLRIGALPTVSARILPDAVRHFIAAEPACTLMVDTSDNTTLHSRLRGGGLDLIISRLPAAEDMAGLNFEHLYSEQILFVVRPGHPLVNRRPFDISLIGNYPLLAPPATALIRPFLDGFLIEQGVEELPAVIQTVSDSFGRAFVRRTDAVWVASTGLVQKDLEDGRLAALDIDTGSTRGSVGMARRAGTPPSPQLLLMMQMIRDTAAADMN